VPITAIRTLVRDAVEPTAPVTALLDAVEQCPKRLDEDLVSALMLRDLLKKPGWGIMFGRTVISAEDGLARAQQVEETGIILFMMLERNLTADTRNEMSSELARRKLALANLIRLDDDLRYHRLRLTSPD
jgi:hypothetical protein